MSVTSKSRITLHYALIYPLSPVIHIQILQSDCHTFPYRISWENLFKDQSIFSWVIILFLLINFSFNYVLIWLGEHWYWSLLGLLKRVSLHPHWQMNHVLEAASTTFWIIEHSTDSLSFIAMDSSFAHSVHNTLFNVLARRRLFTMLLWLMLSVLARCKVLWLYRAHKQSSIAHWSEHPTKTWKTVDWIPTVDPHFFLLSTSSCT